MSNEIVILFIGILYTALIVCLFYGLVLPLIKDQEEIQQWIDKWEEDQSTKGIEFVYSRPILINEDSISSGGGGYMPEPEINMVTVCENQRVVDHNGDFIGYGKEAFDKIGIKHEH